MKMQPMMVVRGMECQGGCVYMVLSPVSRANSLEFNEFNLSEAGYMLFTSTVRAEAAAGKEDATFLELVMMSCLKA